MMNYQTIDSAGVGRSAPLAWLPAIWRSSSRLWRRSPAGIIGGGIVVLIILVAVFAPFVAPHDPLESNLGARLTPPSWSAGGSSEYLLGTDQLGRDVLSRVIYGTRVSLIVGGTAAFLAAIVGTAFGVVAGYKGGMFDEVLMRIADVRLNIPLILLIISVLAIFGPGLKNVIILLAITEWVIYARVIRAEAMALRSLEYVVAARALGASDLRIMAKHVTPGVSSLAIILASAEIGQLILLESTLGFLGLGVPPPTPTWGNMLGEGRDYLLNAWWLATFPGIALTVTVLALMFLGDGLRDWLDPRQKL